MFGLRKSPIKIAKNSAVDPVYPVSSHANPFDSDNEMDRKQKNNSSRASSGPASDKPVSSTNPFDDDEVKRISSSTMRNKYQNDFRHSGGLENQSVQELENYAVYKAEETTKAVNGCLKIAEDIREDATTTLVALHQQGEQITRTHVAAADIDYDLSRVSFSFFGP